MALDWLLGTALALGGCIAATVPMTAQTVEDSFRAGVPAGWSRIGGDLYEYAVDTVAERRGERSYRMATVVDGGSGGLVQSLPVDAFRGRGISYSGRIRTEGVTGNSMISLDVMGPGPEAMVLGAPIEWPSGTTGWIDFTLRVEVFGATDRIVVGVVQNGSGVTWFDSLRVELADPLAWALEQGMRDGADLPSPDTTLPTEDKEIVAHVRATGFSMPVPGQDEGSSALEFLRDVIGDKRVVQLGESAHGVAEFSMAKLQLVTYLHEQLGFDVLAFESPLLGCYMADLQARNLSDEQLMKACVLPVWWTDDVVHLFRYVKQTWETDRPLRLAGFDIQLESSLAGRPQFWRTLLGPLDKAYAEQVAYLEQQLPDYLRPQGGGVELGGELRAGYARVADFITRNAPALEAAHADHPETVDVGLRAAISTVAFLDRSVAPEAFGLAIREQGMADNLDFLLDDLFPGVRTITWAHNFHLRHANDRVIPSVRNMGEWIAERRREEIYTIGLYMRRGRAAFDNRTLYNVRSPQPGSLESILGQLNEPYFFVDLAATGQERPGRWVHEPITTWTWGLAQTTFVPAEQYDAVLFVDEVHPPAYR